MWKWWRWIPAGLAHRAAGWWARRLARQIEYFDAQWCSRKLHGIYFRNPLGIAAGLDKNAEFFQAFESLGFGFVEVGTVTLRAQRPVSNAAIKRYWDRQILWNYLGFPNDGIETVIQRIEKNHWFDLPLFLSIGKTRQSRFEEFLIDEIPQLAQFKSSKVTVVVLNLSSPNTTGLTQWQKETNRLKNLLQAFSQHFQQPKAIKLGPDWETTESFLQTLEIISQFPIQFLILTNSTQQRIGLPKNVPPHGGVSGRYLQELSRWWLQQAVQFRTKTGAPWSIINVGGILTPVEVHRRLQLGADLVQVYSALVFEGFLFARAVAQWFCEKGICNSNEESQKSKS